MNKKFTTTLLTILTATLTLSAQVTLTKSSHSMQIGDALIIKTITDTISAGEAGANQTWDFSKAKYNGDFLINYNQNTDTDMGMSGYALACTENGERTSFCQITDDSKLYYGMKTEKVTIKFDEPLKELAFPFSYGSELSTEMKGAYIEDGYSNPITGTSTVKADGYGTLILPNGVKLENVLRVAIVRDYNHETHGLPYHMVVKQYAFYCKESRYAVMQIKDASMKCDCGCNGREYRAYFNPNVTQASNCTKPIVENSSSIKHKFTYKEYPNPFTDDITVEYQLFEAAKVKISVLDLNGKMMKVLQNKKQEEGSYTVTDKIDGKGAQNLILQIKVGDQVYNEKLIKKHE